MLRSTTFPLALIAIAACSPARDEVAERTGTHEAAFTSAAAVLADFSFEARIIAPTNDPTVVRPLLETQLMYTIGQLNGDRSVARLDRATFAGKTLRTLPGEPVEYELTYDVTLPVAWGGGALPSSYAMTLPLRMTEADQQAFATKYMATCADPEGGIVDAVKDAGRMFLFYRPQLPTCSASPLDVFHATATVTRSNENTTGRFPEYHRIWEDQVLAFVAVFGRETEEAADDAGKGAYDAFVSLVEAHLAELQPAADKRTRSSDANVPQTNVHLSAELADGRRIDVDAIQTKPHVGDESATFDAWYDAHTPSADVIFYAGHAGLGANVRALAKKGVFAPPKYALHVLNGCDTFAYLDPTLAQRRGANNLDVATNVLGGWFHTGDETAMRFLKAMTSALTAPVPQTYAQIAEGVDPSQVMVVTGEEDNVFAPGMIPAPPHADSQATPPSESPAPAAPAVGDVGPRENEDVGAARGRSSGGCTMTSQMRGDHLPALVLALIAALITRRRRLS